MFSTTDTHIHFMAFSRFHWTKNKKDAFWVKNQNLKKKIQKKSKKTQKNPKNPQKNPKKIQKIQKSPFVKMTKKGIKKFVLVPEFNFWNKILVIFPFRRINANKVKFGRFQKKDLQTNFLLIKKLENEFLVKTRKKFFESIYQWLKYQIISTKNKKISL